MGSNLFSPWIIVFFLISTFVVETELADVYFPDTDIAPSSQTNNFVVTDFGAIADGITDNSKAFLNAWIKACATAGGALVVPPTGIYLVNGAEFEGPCNGETSFQIMGTLKASSNPSPDGKDYWIMFYHVDGLTISGSGTFDGNGESTWSKGGCVSSKCNPALTSIKFVQVTNIAIQDVHSINSKMFHIHILGGENVLVQNLNISAPKDSPNTDGIHIGRSNNVKIIDSHIATGDDCISIGDGCTNINVTGIWCGPGHGISVGSLGKYENEKDVSEMTVKNCTLTDTENGLRIKTWATTSAIIASNITFVDININNAKNPIVVDQYYCPHSTCNSEGDSNVAIKDVKFINIQGNSATAIAIKIRCSKIKPCEDIEFSGLNISFDGQPATASCSNAGDKFIGVDQVPSSCSSSPLLPLEK